MIRVDTPHGRGYWARKGLLLPSVTTVLKDTDPKPFSTAVWSKSLMRKGLSHHLAMVYAEAFIEQGLPPALAHRHTERFIETPMTRDEAKAYMAWKSPHSAERGNRLHKALEELLVVVPGACLTECPTDPDPATALLLQSLWKGGVLQQIEEVHSIEERLWYYYEDPKTGECYGYAGSEDICYTSIRGKVATGDWKTKDPKSYSPTDYASEYKLQTVAYAVSRAVRKRQKIDELHIHYPFSDGSPAETVVCEKEEMRELWSDFVARLKAWWAIKGVDKILNYYNEHLGNENPD